MPLTPVQAFQELAARRLSLRRVGDDGYIVVGPTGNFIQQPKMAFANPVQAIDDAITRIDALEERRHDRQAAEALRKSFNTNLGVAPFQVETVPPVVVSGQVVVPGEYEYRWAVIDETFSQLGNLAPNPLRALLDYVIP